jgi:thiamine-monophosphate kinase
VAFPGLLGHPAAVPPRVRLSENELIARYFAPLAGEGALGLRDDTACLMPRPGWDLVLTVDALVETVHFLPEDAPGSVAHKALAVNVSDLAAKGADPVGFLLALSLPPGWTADWLGAFAKGLGRASRAFGCPLLGGDTVKANGALTLSVTALGETPAGRLVRRTAAQPGDVLCVSGTIGDGALGLMLRRDPPWARELDERQRSFLADRYLHPQPRLSLARAVRAYASAAMDVSDGLVGDLTKMMRGGGVSAVVDLEAVPLSDAAQAALAAEASLRGTILTGGDDYEILCAVPERRLPAFREAASRAGVPLTRIGRVVEGSTPPVFRLFGEEQRFAAGSYSHF